MSKIGPIRRLFRPSIKALQADGRITDVENGGLFGQTTLVLSRALCRYQFHKGDFRGTKAQKALSMRLRHNAAYADTGLYTKTGSDGAACWLWDNAVLHYDGKDLPSHWKVVPESALFPSMENGSRLIRCLNGYEGQVWQDGIITVARWWPEKPETADWKLLLRAAQHDITDQTQPPLATTPYWQTPPLIDGPWQEWLKQTVKARFATLALLLLIAPFSYQLAKLAKAAYIHNHYEEQTAQLRQSAAPVLAARRDSLSARAAIDAQKSIGDEAVFLKALLEWSDALSDIELEIERIRYSHPEIALYINGDVQDNAARIVQNVEDTLSWSDVSLQPAASDTFILRGQLIPFAAPISQIEESP